MFAYGLDVAGLPRVPGLVGSPTLPWHRVSLTTRLADPPAETSCVLEADAARLEVAGYGSVSVERHTMTAQVSTRHPATQDEVIHPVLTFISAVVARWVGRDAFHAATVLLDDRAWAVLAEPGGGKSSLMSSMNERGHPVLADDLTVLSDRTVLAGPRSCDLRGDASDALVRGDRIEVDVGRPRFRVNLSPAPYEAELGGFLVLEWGEEWAITRPDIGRRLELLTNHQALGSGPATERSFLTLMSLPVYELTRPRDWGVLEQSCDLLEDLASGRRRP